jgi:hypothetical protein
MTGCDCCGGSAARTPVEIANRPGLAAVQYRAGTWATFRESMRAGLSRDGRPALAALRTRAEDDPAIALIDAWASAADVLTFYTERIANEHYLRTATERRSVADLVSLLGYRLGPGVAARTWLAFTLETAPGAPPAAVIPARTRVQTLPGPGEVPQTFETTGDLPAVGAWNRPVLGVTEARTPRNEDTHVLLAGTATGLRPGQQLLFVADDWTATTRWAQARVTSVTADPAQGTTSVAFTPALAGLPLVAGAGVSVHGLGGQAALFGFNAPNPLLFESSVLDALIAAKLVEATTRDWTFAAVTNEVVLDGAYDAVEPDGFAVLSGPATAELARIAAIREITMSAYAVSGRVTALTFTTDSGSFPSFGGAATRRTLVSFRSHRLELAEVAVTAPLHGSVLPLGAPVPPQAEDRRVLIRGKRARGLVPGPAVQPGPGRLPDVPVTVLTVEPALELPGQLRWRLRPDDSDDVTVVGDPGTVTYHAARDSDEVVGEVVTVAGTTGVETLTELVLRLPLVNVYDMLGGTGVDLYGNVADATHGESVLAEVLGSADAARSFQRFALRRKPLTFVPAPTTTGGESTLEVRVNDVRWHEVPTLYAAGPRDRVYVTRTADDGTTTVIFGDAVTGAATPTGTDNVTATYRSGSGSAGNARADQLTLPMTRPLGLKAVTNPLAAGGGQDPPVMADARFNAPRSVLILGRVVSLQDYADFAAAFAGIAKAAAAWTWDGARRGIAVTVAAAGGGPIPAASPLVSSLSAALLAAGNNRIALTVRDVRAATFAVQALLRVSADHDATLVRDAVAAALLATFSFDARDFGQGVSLSEVAGVVHAVAGVEAVRVDRLHRTDEPVALHAHLSATGAGSGGPPDGPPAEILTLTGDGLDLGVGW